MLSYNVKLSFINDCDKEYWISLLQKLCNAYNDMSDLIFDNKNTNLNLKDIHNLCYYPIRRKYEDIPAQAIIKLTKELLSSYKSNKRKYKCEKKTLSLMLDKRLYSNLKTDSISLSSSTPHKRCKVDFITYDRFNDLSSKYAMKDPTIFCRHNELYLSIPFDVPNKPILEETYLGIDLGIKRFYTTSDGDAIKTKDLNRIKRRIRYSKRKLNSKKSHSHSARKKLKNIKNRERNISKEYCNLMVNQILKTDKTVIVMEDLKKIKTTTSRTNDGYKRKKHNNMISQVPFYMFKSILSYKAQLIGKRVETVSPVYTSQTDCTTGKRDGIRKGCRYYSSKGYVLDADWNAAVNIMNRKHPTPFKPPIDGKLNFVGRVQTTTQS